METGGGARRTFGGSLILFVYSGLSGTGETCPRISRSRGSYPAASYYRGRLHFAHDHPQVQATFASSAPLKFGGRKKKKNSTTRTDRLLFVNSKSGSFAWEGESSSRGRRFVNNRDSLAAKSIPPNVAGLLSRSWITRAECSTAREISSPCWRFDNPLLRNPEDEVHRRRRRRSGGIKGCGGGGGGANGEEDSHCEQGIRVHGRREIRCGPAYGPYCVPKGHIQ